VQQQKPMLNLGCGRIILPGDKPAHHQLVDDSIYQYPEWVNIDKNDSPGINQVMDLFCYPWNLPDNAFSGALISHVCEHIPHEIKTNDPEIAELQDGWFAFFGELWRVLEHGAVVHILSPHGHSDDGITDPTHTRYLSGHTFNHSMQPNPDAPFNYNRRLNFAQMEETPMRPTEWFARPPYFVDGQATEAFWIATHTQINVIRDFYVRLVCIKE
jgi:hypothetical protein